jgi:hypothetical protein
MRMSPPSLLQATAAYDQARRRVLSVHQATLAGRATHLDLALAVKACAEAEDTLQRVVAGCVPERRTSARKQPS